MISNRYTRLSKWQQRFVSMLLGLFVVVLINSVLLLLFDRSTASAYMGMVFVHVLLGSLVLLPAAAFLTLHVRKMPLNLNRAATIAGVLTASSIGVLLATGFALVYWGASVADGWVLGLHIGTAVTSVLGFVGHISLKRGVRYHFLEWTDQWKDNTRVALRHPFSIVLLAGLAVTAAFLVSAWQYSLTPTFIETDSQNPLSPGQAVLAHDEFLEVEDLTRSSCGQSGCHPDIYEQWQASVHHFSSFNNPYYRRSTERLMARKSVAKARWCASCHDPAVLFSGAMQDSTLPDLDSKAAQAGLTCLSCHAAKGLRDVKGNGRLVMAEPDEYPFARAESGLGRWVHNTLLRAKPEPHREAMLKPMHKTAAFCGSCHKVSIPPEVNDYRWKRGQNQYDSWHASGVSGNTVRSFYLPDKPQTCTSCHMPLVPSDDQGNDDGYVRSHRFVSANTAVPKLKEHTRQVELARQTLQDSIATLDLFRVQVNNRTYGPEEPMPVLHPGDQVTVDLVVRNRKVGHILPAGTNDSNEMWVELKAQGAEGGTVLASGLQDQQRYVDSTAHFFGSVLVDEHSRLIDKRDVQNWMATVYANTISPGTAHTVHYEFTVPSGASITALQARLRYRKFRQRYHRWVFQDSASADVPVQPVTTLAATRREAGEAPRALRPLWERWNDYGIGLFLEGNMQRAVEAFQETARIAPSSPEGPINQARVFLEEGQLDKAADALAEADQRRPGYLKTAYFRGLLYKANGRYPKALDAWNRVASAYPQDRVVLLNIGRLHYLLGEYEQALTWFDRVLEINPESVGAIYNRMLTLGALGREDAFAAARERYKYHKQNESEQAVTTAYKKKHPMDNREAQPIHYHGLHPVVQQELVSQKAPRRDGPAAQFETVRVP